MSSGFEPLPTEQEKKAIDAITALDWTTPYSPSPRRLPADWPWPEGQNSRSRAVSEIKQVLSISLEQSENIVQDLVVKQKKLWEQAPDAACKPPANGRWINDAADTLPAVKWSNDEAFMPRVIEALLARPYENFDQSWRLVKDSCKCPEGVAQHILYFVINWNILKLTASSTSGLLDKWVSAEDAA